MKKLFISCIVLISTQISFAQDGKLWLSLGAGLNKTPNAGREHSTGNGFNVQADAFVPFYRKGWDGAVKGGRFTLGVNISGNYTGIRNPQPDNTDVAGRYQVYQGNVVVTDQSEGKISGGFSGLAGIQARMDLGKFNLAPSVNFGYLHFKQKGYTQTGSLRVNDQTQQKDLVKSEQQSTNGFVLKPQLKIGYNIARNFSFFISPAMVLGPTTSYTTYYLVPQGGFNDKNTYETSQLARGTMESSTHTGRYRLMEINAGITMAIGKKQTTAKQSQGMNFGEKVAGGLQSGANAKAVADSGKGGITKPGGAVSSSYAAGKAVSPDNESGTPQAIPATDFNTTRSNRDNRLSTDTESDSTNIGSSSMPGRLSMTPTTTRQTQGMNFGEKVGSGLQSGANAGVVSSEIPFTGKNIRLQNFVVTVDGNGAKLNDGTPVVNSKTVKGKITTKQTGAASASYARVRITQPETGDDETTIADEHGNFKIKLVHDTLHHVYINDEEFGKIKIIEDNSTQRIAGGPIGGIIVKGGKNPGGQMLTATTNENGEILLDNLEAGHYLFRLSSPELPAGKSINEKGVKRGEGAAIARPGTPIGGIIVKGGKNPGGQMLTAITNENGGFSFDVTEPGNYVFKVFNPAESGKGIQEAGVRGMAKPGGAVSSSYAAGRVAGGPLKGIDVKLGKSPNGGIQAKAVTNEKGEVEFKGLEPGIYEMTPDLPQNAEAQDFNTTRSNRERGQLAANPGSGSTKNDDLQKAEAQDFNTTRSNRERGQLAARPGQPIGGIVVKGGKNPGGAMTNLTIDDDRTIRFEVLEAGNYKFTFSNRQETQGIINTTKSNTKD